MKYFRTHIIPVFCFLLLGGNVFAQKATAVADRQKILLGEQIQLQLKLEGLPTDQATVAQWFNLPDTFNHLEVVNRSKIDTLDINGVHTYIQTLNVTGFDSGRWTIPALSVYIASAGAQTGRALQTLPIAIDVLPVDVSELKDYHPIKDIVEVKPISDWWIWLAIGLGAIFLIFLIVWLFKRKKKEKPSEPKSKLPPLEEALHALKELQTKNESQTVSDKEFYSEIDFISRRFFTRRSGFKAMQKTPDEFMLQLKTLMPSYEQQLNFFQLVRLISAVKFAKFRPDISERNKAIQTTTETLKQINSQQTS